MRNTNTFSVTFIPRIKKGRISIYVRIYLNKTRSEICLKKYIEIGQWDNTNGCAKSLTPELIEINDYLFQYKEKVIESYRILKTEDRHITAVEVKESFLGNRLTIGSDIMTMKNLIDVHHSMMQKVLEPGTLKNYYATAQYIQRFMAKKFANKDVYLYQLKASFITEFEHYVRSNPLKPGDPCTNNGTMKHMERLKKMVRWAFINEWISRDPFAAYKLKFKRSIMGFLEQEELDRLELQTLEPLLAQTRDLFVFACYTGLSYVDLFALEPRHVVPSVNGMRWIKSERKKTGIPLNIPLLKPALKLLVQFLSEEDAKQRTTLFPTISNQKINERLKTIARQCRINKPVTFHYARHTFATTVTLMNGMPIETISTLLGHTKLTTTMIYSHMVNAKLGEDTKALEKRLDTLRIVK